MGFLGQTKFSEGTTRDLRDVLIRQLTVRSVRRVAKLRGLSPPRSTPWLGHKIGGNVRAPLVVTIADRLSGETFVFMANHLYRSNSRRRNLQAEGLNAWVSEIKTPVIAVGDYNFDWNYRGGQFKHDRGYDLLTKDGRFSWVEPKELVPTQCIPKFRSVLDFVFVANAGKVLRPLDSETFFTGPDYCEDCEANSDHRPVVVNFELGSGMPLGAMLGDQACPGNRLDNAFFVICHEPKRIIPVWVGYHLTEDGLEGREKRTNDFRPEPDLRLGERAELSDYRGSGIDRGHMAAVKFTIFMNRRSMHFQLTEWT